MRSATLITPCMRVLLLPAALLLAACAQPLPVPDLIKPHRVTIQQGNFVSKEMVEQLRPGMSREQVRFILGTPLVTDIFHSDRWDYVFSLNEPGGRKEQRNFSVIFENAKLTRVIGDLLPSDPVPAAAKPAAKPVAAKPEAAKLAAEVAKPGTEAAPVPQPEAKAERGFFGRILEKIGF